MKLEKKENYPKSSLLIKLQGNYFHVNIRNRINSYRIKAGQKDVYQKIDENYNLMF